MNATLHKPIAAASLVDSIVDRLETAIVTGELAPGAKILEAQIAASLGVSRGPLREAVQRLVGRKLVQVTPYVGAHVAELSPADLEEIIELREALESMACRLAAERMTPEEIKALRAVIRRRRESKDSTDRLHDRTSDFHYLIAKASRNRRLIGLLCDDLYYLLKVHRYQSSVRPGRHRASLQEHSAIADAIAERDPERAERLMRLHIRSVHRQSPEEDAQEQSSEGRQLPERWSGDGDDGAPEPEVTTAGEGSSQGR